MRPFIPGLELCKLFHQEAVGPILENDFAGLRYSAALVGDGSEVLGFDTPMSSDHDWGPRLMLFVNEDELELYGERIVEVLGQKLPFQFRGWPTGFETHANGSGVPQFSETRPVHHRIRVYSLRTYFKSFLGWDPQQDLAPADWLSFPQQKLRAVTAGSVFRDVVGLQAVRDRLRYYPQDVWLYMLAAQWKRIGQEEHLMGRAGLVGDELGSALIASRLVRDLMNLGFLMEKIYAPYPKWFGTAFKQLKCAKELAPLLERVQPAAGWQERGTALAVAYETAAVQFNELGITKPMEAETSQFYDRPFPVIWGERFAKAVLEQIMDEAVLAIAAKGLIGSIDQISDNTDLLGYPEWRKTVRQMYE